jgi:hypothetical protein
MENGCDENIQIISVYFCLHLNKMNNETISIFLILGAQAIRVILGLL